ncbi:MAG: DUF2130 domain-containing protein [Clostridia bacterium]|nr:DUF2130 domain-containing protein [Clostridia bacterium]
MNEIKCPKCGEVFQVDEAGYSALIKQVKDKEFEKEIKSQLQLELTKVIETYNNQIHKKDTEIKDLQFQIDVNRKDADLNLTNAIIKANEEHQKETNEMLQKIQSLENQLAILNSSRENDIKLAVINKDNQINSLKLQIEHNKQDQKHFEEMANNEKEKLISNYRAKEQELIHEHEKEIREKDIEIEYYKDLKSKLSTKLLGETLEQHCQIEFNRLRATGFQNAYFEKDNDAKSGSKGDFIFRDFGEDGTEFISIMFEMKNEADTTATKKKNEDFFKELDKDRREKNCEYAVLVTMLEADNELYSGITDVSYKYPKMYVVRPQFFIPIITLLRNSASNALQYRQELAIIKNQNLDITRFEEDMNDFKVKFSRNYRLASEKFQKAIEEIDKTIIHLQNIKSELLSSENNLRLANNKAQDLSIKRLTEHNPTMKQKFDELKAKD